MAKIVLTKADEKHLIEQATKFLSQSVMYPTKQLAETQAKKELAAFVTAEGAWWMDWRAEDKFLIWCKEARLEKLNNKKTSKKK